MRPDADEASRAHATFVLGAASVFDGDLATGARLLEEAHAQHRTLDELDSNVIMTRVALAITVAFEGDLARAESLCLEARNICLAQWRKMGVGLRVLGARVHHGKPPAAHGGHRAGA